jgi:type IV pilus assembly protein PilV
MTTGKSTFGREFASGGFTLLEVLIALVILSIGLLGIAALQGVGIRSSHGSYLTSQASLLAYDIADRIRANPQPVATFSGFDTDSIDCEQVLPTAPLATADLAEWACAVQNLLPSGNGVIAGTEDVATGITTYTIDLEWQDLQTEDVDNPWTYQLVIEL